MNRHSRFMITILAIIFSLTAFASLTAMAESFDDQVSGGDLGPQESYVEPEPQQSYVEPEPQQSYVEPEPQQSYAEPQQSYEQPDYNQGGNSDVYYDSDGNEYSDYNEMYVGGDQTYTPPASTPSTTAALYETSKNKIDNSTLTKSDWDAIKANLGDGKNSASSSGDDFTWIQGNTSKEDDGHWRLILGIALILLSVVGFVYLIASAVNRRKRTALAHAGKQHTANANGPRYRSNNDYNDNFSPSSNKKPKNGKRYK